MASNFHYDRFAWSHLYTYTRNSVSCNLFLSGFNRLRPGRTEFSVMAQTTLPPRDVRFWDLVYLRFHYNFPFHFAKPSGSGPVRAGCTDFHACTLFHFLSWTQSAPYPWYPHRITARLCSALLYGWYKLSREKPIFRGLRLWLPIDRNQTSHKWLPF